MKPKEALQLLKYAMKYAWEKRNSLKAIQNSAKSLPYFEKLRRICIDILREIWGEVKFNAIISKCEMCVVSMMRMTRNEMVMAEPLREMKVVINLASW